MGLPRILDEPVIHAPLNHIVQSPKWDNEKAYEMWVEEIPSGLKRSNVEFQLVPPSISFLTHIIPKLIAIPKFLQMVRDHHTAANHQAIVQAITSVRDAFTEDALAQARRQRDDAIQGRDAIVAAKALVEGKLNESTLSLRKVEAELEKVAAKLGHTEQQRDAALTSDKIIMAELKNELEAAISERDDAKANWEAVVAAKSLVECELEGKASSLGKAKADLEKAKAELSSARVDVSEIRQNVLKRLDDIEHRMKKLEDDATTMANK
ncbi:hypothetical protein OQA88_6801 [Cercophora sp. LCS_1]